jgi:hypothetical protein
MDWIQVLTIILSTMGLLIVFLVFILNRMDNGFSNLRNDLRSEIQQNRIDIQKNREEILWIKFRLDPNEHPEWKKEKKVKNED